MKLNPVECPKCGRESIALWYNDQDALCDICGLEMGFDEPRMHLQYKLLVCPQKSPNGIWQQTAHIDFSALREFFEVCLLPRRNDNKYPNLCKTIRSFKSIITILEELANTPPDPYGNPRIKLKLDLIDERIAQNKRELAHEEKGLSVIRKQLKRIRHQQIAIKLRKSINLLEKEKETLMQVDMTQLSIVRQHAISRLRRDLELRQRGLLGLEFDVPLRQVYWELLGPSGDSWQELIRYFEYLSQIRNEVYDIERLKFTYDFKPDVIYQGLACFEGYIAFCFQRAQTAALECPKVGNALYFMNLKEWKFLSQLSKTELLDGPHHHKFTRVIHSGFWKSEVRQQFALRGIS